MKIFLRNHEFRIAYRKSRKSRQSRKSRKSRKSCNSHKSSIYYILYTIQYIMASTIASAGKATGFPESSKTIEIRVFFLIS